MFGFVLLAFIVLLVVCAETSILLCYFHLCAEDYRWWWRSFFSTGTTALFLLLFCVHYFFFKTSITGSLSYLIYFTYTSIIVFLFFIFTGKYPLALLHLAAIFHCIHRHHWVYSLLLVRVEDIQHCEDRLRELSKIIKT